MVTTAMTGTAAVSVVAGGDDDDDEEEEEEEGEEGDEEAVNCEKAPSTLSSLSEGPPRCSKAKARPAAAVAAGKPPPQEHLKWGGFGPSHVPRFFRGRFGVAGEKKRLSGRRVDGVGGLDSEAVL